MLDVRADCACEGFEFGVGHIELIARLLHNFGQIRIVHMADPREKVVLHLEIQTTQKPREKTALRSKIRSSLNLVNRPFVFGFQRLAMHIGGEGRFRNNVCQLEDDGQNKARRHAHEHESAKPGKES